MYGLTGKATGRHLVEKSPPHDARRKGGFTEPERGNFSQKQGSLIPEDLPGVRGGRGGPVLHWSPWTLKKALLHPPVEAEQLSGEGGKVVGTQGWVVRAGGCPGRLRQPDLQKKPL